MPYILVLHLVFDLRYTEVISPCSEGRSMCSQILLSQTGNERARWNKVQIITVAASFPGCWVSRQPRRRSFN